MKLKRALICALLLFALVMSMSAMAETDGFTVDRELQSANVGLALPDTEGIFDDYVQSAFGQKKLNASRVYREMLTDMEKEVYDALEAALEKTASGESESTVFEIPISQLGHDVFTAEELGVSVDYDAEYKKINNKEEIAAALEAYYRERFDAVRTLTALMRDNPYLFYWMSNKVAFRYYELPYTKWTPQKTSGVWYINLEGKYYYLLPVDVLFAADAEYTIDTEKTGSIQTAADNAAAILRDASDEDDFSKMVMYMQRIRKLSTYDYDAAAGYSENSAPWQMIYLFDGDPDTKVVCEGYSKGFQYLCDKTDFDNSSLKVYIATGKMNGGGHMWNTVHTQRGNYLVDITNCDTSGSVENTLFFTTPLRGSPSEGYTLPLKSKYNDSIREIVYQYDDAIILSFEELNLTDTHLEASVRAKLKLKVGESVDLWHEGLGASPVLNAFDEEYEVDPSGNEIFSCSSDGHLTALSAGSTRIILYGLYYTVTLDLTVVEGMETINLPSALRIIGEDAFDGMNMERLILPDKIESIDGGLCDDMPMMGQIVIPEGLDVSVLGQIPTGDKLLWLCRDIDTASYAKDHGIRYILYQQ